MTPLRKPLRHVLLMAATLTAAAPFTRATGWVAEGPGPIQFGQVEGSGQMAAQNSPVSGAVRALLPDPTNANILYAASVNGGIWRTTNATAPSPTWTPLTDQQPSLAMGSLSFDFADPTHQTLWASNGVYSSFGSGGNKMGLLKSADGGSTWTSIAGGMTGRNINSLVVNGSTVVASVEYADSYTYSNIGIFRSINGGASFSQVSSGLPGGASYNVVADPNHPNILHTSVVFAGANNGVYRSADTGATWARVSDAVVNSYFSDNTTRNVRFSIGNSGQVYVGIVNNGAMNALFRSTTPGVWTKLDNPQTVDGGTTNGLNPEGEADHGGLDGPPTGTNPGWLDTLFTDPGGQGSIHFSIAADPNNANIVYVGGDRQPSPFPNALGAVNYSGRLFRVDAGQPSGSQAASLTHLLGVSTTDNSAAHADSRSLVVDASGNIIEGDDGGIYRRSNPLSLGAWSSVIGNLAVTEFHSVAYDHNTHTMFGGAQDTGTPGQPSPGATVWNEIAQGDGGVVAVDAHAANISYRYTYYYYLQGFTLRAVNSANQVISTSSPSLIVNGTGGMSISSYDSTVGFYAPIATNKQNGNLIIGSQRLYESTDRGTSLTVLKDFGSGVSVNAFDAGAANNAAAIWVGTNSNTASLWMRNTSGGPVNAVPAYNALSGATAVVALAMSPVDYADAAVVDANQIFMTNNAGTTFLNLTGSLAGGNPQPLSVAWAVLGGLDTIFVGLRSGDVYMTRADAFGTWTKVGDLPNAPVWSLQYDATDDVLAAGTLGRGAFLFQGVSTLAPEPSSLALLGLACTGLVVRWRARRR